MSEPAVLPTWTIFYSPADEPGLYVLRQFDVVQGHAEPVPSLLSSTHATLDEARDAVPDSADVCFPRSPGDDPAIVETWM